MAVSIGLRLAPFLSTQVELGLQLKVSRSLLKPGLLDVIVTSHEGEVVAEATARSRAEAMGFCNEAISAAKTKDPRALIVLDLDPAL